MHYVHLFFTLDTFSAYQKIGSRIPFWIYMLGSPILTMIIAPIILVVLKKIIRARQ